MCPTWVYQIIDVFDETVSVVHLTNVLKVLHHDGIKSILEEYYHDYDVELPKQEFIEDGLFTYQLISRIDGDQIKRKFSIKKLRLH